MTAEARSSHPGVKIIALGGIAINSASNVNRTAAVPQTSNPDAGPMDSHAAPDSSLKLDECTYSDEDFYDEPASPLSEDEPAGAVTDAGHVERRALEQHKTIEDEQRQLELLHKRFNSGTFGREVSPNDSIHIREQLTQVTNVSSTIDTSYVNRISLHAQAVKPRVSTLVEKDHVGRFAVLSEVLEAQVVFGMQVQESFDVPEYKQWVQCDRCDKWRRLDGNALPASGNKWFCAYNSDPAYNSCNALEEKTYEATIILKASDLNSSDVENLSSDSANEGHIGDADANVFEVQLKTGKRNRGSEDHQLPAVVEADGTWSCRRCTFENKAECSYCAMCVQPKKSPMAYTHFKSPLQCPHCSFSTSWAPTLSSHVKSHALDTGKNTKKRIRRQVIDSDVHIDVKADSNQEDKTESPLQVPLHEEEKYGF